MAEIDTSRPSIARVYDVMLDGKDNYAADRALAAQLLEINPDAAVIARDNRAWLVRAVRFLCAERGITQFLDCGSGLPTAENTHQVLQRLDDAARVLYVDNDPIVLAHGAALLTSSNSAIIDGDVRFPDALLDRPEVREFFDWTRPVGLLLVGVLHHVPGDGVLAVVGGHPDAMRRDRCSPSVTSTTRTTGPRCRRRRQRRRRSCWAATSAPGSSAPGPRSSGCSAGGRWSSPA